MKTFEEKLTAWVDGELKGRELAEFEAELAGVKEAKPLKLAANKIGGLLREHGRAPELKNEDFFNHQLMQRIEAELPKQEEAATPPRRKFAWSLPRLALAGAFSMAVAFGIFQMAVPGKVANQPAAPESPNSVEIINTKGGGPGISVSTFRSQQNDVVIWVEGSKYMPDKNAQAEKHKEK